MHKNKRKESERRDRTADRIIRMVTAGVYVARYVAIIAALLLGYLLARFMRPELAAAHYALGAIITFTTNELFDRIASRLFELLLAFACKRAGITVRHAADGLITVNGE